MRANAFHLNSHSGYVRLVHFGNRAISLENYGSPSSLVLRAYGEAEKLKIKEALCYLAPEQTGSIETMTQDHRTDLYSLGILFWTLLVGRGQMPFEGGALELLHSIVQKRPMPVHEVRRDVPQVLANIIDKVCHCLTKMGLYRGYLYILCTAPFQKPRSAIPKRVWLEDWSHGMPAATSGYCICCVWRVFRGLSILNQPVRRVYIDFIAYISIRDCIRR